MSLIRCRLLNYFVHGTIPRFFCFGTSVLNWTSSSFLKLEYLLLWQLELYHIWMLGSDTNSYLPSWECHALLLWSKTNAIKFLVDCTSLSLNFFELKLRFWWTHPFFLFCSPLFLLSLLYLIKWKKSSIN